MTRLPTDSHNLAEERYNLSRLEPTRGDALYLFLADLRCCLELVRSEEALKVLDYGAGGSPYRPLFPASE